MDLLAQFKDASERVKTLSQRPSNDELLRLYSLYKQGSEGDITGDKPGMFDFVAVAKYNAWEKLRGTPKESAMQQYIDEVNRLMAK